MQNTNNMPASGKDKRRIVMVIYPDAHILDVVGPLEVLTGVSLFLPDGIQPYDVEVVAHRAGSIRTTSGLTIDAAASFVEAGQDMRPIDTLMIAGGHGTMKAIEDPDLMAFVDTAARQSTRIVSICTGALILAELGLLDNRRVTTHWWWCPILAQKYPNVHIDADAIYVRDGNVWTSAGVTAGMDLALSLVEMDWGHSVAIQVARYNVMYRIRPGGQSQFSAHLIAQRSEDPVINKILDHVLGNLADSLTVTNLAAHACMSERTFARKFKEDVGVTPAHYVEQARVQAARVELEQSNLGIEQISIQVGFQSGERMRRAFLRHLGISATDYRERFRSVAPRASESWQGDP